MEEEKEEKHRVKCKDLKCPVHGNLSARGRRFKGMVKKIAGKRAVIDFEKSVYYKKYERYARKRTKLHAYIPECLAPRIAAGSTVEIQECRPLSKIIHFVVVNVVEIK